MSVNNIIQTYNLFLVSDSSTWESHCEACQCTESRLPSCILPPSGNIVILQNRNVIFFIIYFQSWYKIIFSLWCEFCEEPFVRKKIVVWAIQKWLYWAGTDPSIFDCFQYHIPSHQTEYYFWLGVNTSNVYMSTQPFDQECLAYNWIYLPAPVPGGEEVDRNPIEQDHALHHQQHHQQLVEGCLQLQQQDYFIYSRINTPNNTHFTIIFYLFFKKGRKIHLFFIHFYIYIKSSIILRFGPWSYKCNYLFSEQGKNYRRRLKFNRRIYQISFSWNSKWLICFTAEKSWLLY